MSNLIFICNECGIEFHTYEEEPERCSCGADNFGIMEKDKNVNR